MTGAEEKGTRLDSEREKDIKEEEDDEEGRRRKWGGGERRRWRR